MGVRSGISASNLVVGARGNGGDGVHSPLVWNGITPGVVSKALCKVGDRGAQRHVYAAHPPDPGCTALTMAHQLRHPSAFDSRLGRVSVVTGFDGPLREPVGSSITGAVGYAVGEVPGAEAGRGAAGTRQMMGWRFIRLRERHPFPRTI